MNSKVAVFIVVVAVVVIGWIALRHSSPSYTNTTSNTDNGTTTQDLGGSSPAPTSTSTDNTGSTSTTTMTPAVKEFTIHGKNYSFTPNTMTVNKGDTVKVTFVDDFGSHNFAIDEFNVKTAIIQGGQSETVTFVADKSGTFQYYCSVGSHRALGMVGTLTVN